MRIGLYGLPSAGKTYILSKINFIDVISGSALLHQYVPDFKHLDEDHRKQAREIFASRLIQRSDFIMDGHYAFGDEVAFTEADGQLYDVFLYLYIDPEIIRTRMANSEKNTKYLRFNIDEWQRKELESLRCFCHKLKKDFYVLDNPPNNVFYDVSDIIKFIREIKDGYSCHDFAHQCAQTILRTTGEDTITLLDGDKTLTIEDSSNAVLGYRTNLYDGNFYTGYQAWRQNNDFLVLSCPVLSSIPVHLNNSILQRINNPAFILTSGHKRIWEYISEHINIPVFCGSEMTAETKLFITEELQAAGRKVIAYGDGMNDYYMLRQADIGYLVTKPDKTISRSLKGKSLEGLTLV